jgi:hypothetical protein
MSYRHARIRNAVASTLLAIPLVAVRLAGAPLDMRLHIDASLRTNAVYHLSCLAGSISCSREIFERSGRNVCTNRSTTVDRSRVAAPPRKSSRVRARNGTLTTSDQRSPAAPGQSGAKSGDCRSHRKRDRPTPSSAARPG